MESLHRDIPLNGRLILSDPATIGTNFRQLTNLEYTDTHVRGIAGMTKINTTALTTYLKTRNAFHYRKTQPAESHLLAQVYDTGLTASQVLQNTTAIPSAGDFSGTVLWPVTGSSGAARGYFSGAPDEQMIYANSVDTCIWGGSEMRIGAFITSTVALATIGASCTAPKDYTDIINNTKSDSENVAVVGGGLDDYVSLLIHGDEADGTAGVSILDSSTVATKTITANGNAQTDSDEAKFGQCSVLFDGAGDYLSIPDHADWNLADQPFMVDFWVMFHTLPDTGQFVGIFEQRADATHYVKLYLEGVTNALTSKIRLAYRDGGAETLSNSITASIVSMTWYHIGIRRLASDTAIISLNGNTNTTISALGTMPDVAAALDIGRFYDETGAAYRYLDGWIDELRWSKGTSRYDLAYFSPPAKPYTAAARTFLLMSPRPAQGAKFTVQTANGTANTLTVKEANGNNWVTLSHTDNTDLGGASFAQTGTITWPTTINTSKPLYLQGRYGYWYQFTMTNGECEISHVTLDCPFQPILDMWDGVFRDITRFFQFTTVYLENTTNVLREDYDSTSAATYYAIGGLAAFSTPNNCLEVGFTEKQTGLRIGVAVANTTAGTDMSIDFWNGTEYATVGTISDGTKAGGTISINTTGVVSWNNNSIADETKKVVSNSPPLYYYRIRFDQAISAGARIDYVGGISAQKSISYFKFPVFAQGRVLLCADMSGDKHKAICSSKYMPQVYNGFDSVDIFYGDGGELTCGVELFSQFGSSLYSLVLMFKDNETWMMAGQDIDQWADNTFLLSSSVGCPAPQTLKTINLAADPGGGTNRSLAIWQGTNGIYMSDGRAPIPIHGDIKEFFDPAYARYINVSKIGDSVGWTDPLRMKYHWKFASGASTTLNEEWVYDIKRNKWHEVDRGTGKSLQCGVTVYDTDGNPYTYGFLDTGYMERLNYGTTFDGTAITHTVQTGDMVLNDRIGYTTRIKRIKTVMVAKSTTTNTLAVTHYGDSRSSGQSFTTAVSASGQRIAISRVPQNYGDFLFHSLKYVMVTSDETVGFEPLAVGIFYSNEREE